MGEGKKGMARKKERIACTIGNPITAFSLEAKEGKKRCQNSDFSLEREKKGRKKRIYGKKE